MIPPRKKQLLIICPSMRKGPEPQLLLPDRPEPRQPVRFEHQEQHDQRAENHELHVRRHGGRQPHAHLRGDLVERDRQRDDEGRAEIRPEDRSHAADDDHEEQRERQVEVERERFPGTEVQEAPQRAGDAAVERAHAEGGELRVHRADADHLRGDVHVARRHPGTPEVATREVLRDQRAHDQDAEQEDVLLARRADRPAKKVDRRRGHRPRVRVVGEPLHPREDPVGEELRGECRDRKVKALDAQARDAEEHADERGDESREHEHDEEVQHRHALHEVVRRVSAPGHERRMPDRDLPAVADQEVEPDRRERQDQERVDDRQEQVVGRDERQRDEREYDERDHEIPVLHDRQQLHVGAVRRLELTVLAEEHGASYTRSMRRSPNSPSGRTSRNSSASTYANQFSTPPPARSNSLMSGGARNTSAIFSPTPMMRPPTIAPGTDSKPPRMTTGSAFSATCEIENCTPSLPPQTTPPTIATMPATDHTMTQMRFSGMPIDCAAWWS